MGLAGEDFVVGVLGLSLLSRVTTGLLDAKERISIGEATAGLGEAQRILDAADTGPSTPAPSRLVDSVVSALAARAGSPSTFDVLLLSAQPSTDAPERGTNLVAESSVPANLRDAVVTSQRQSWTYTQINFLDGRSTWRRIRWNICAGVVMPEWICQAFWPPAGVVFGPVGV